MKKIMSVLAAGLLLTAAVAADHPDDRVGIGFLGNMGGGGGTGGFAGYYGSYGLNLRLPGIPVFWGLGFSQVGGLVGVRVSGDWYLFDGIVTERTLENEDGIYNLRLHWYAGPGLFANLLFGAGSGAAFGVRFPFGVSWHITRDFEMSVGLAPGIGFNVGTYYGAGFFWKVPAEISLRYWFPARARGNGNGVRNNDIPAPTNGIPDNDTVNDDIPGNGAENGGDGHD